MITHWRINLHGQVQGVSLRAATARKAKELGLTGFVRNEPDGTVYLEAEGEKEILEKLGDWFRHGGHFAEVTKFEVTEGPCQKFSEFLIR